MPVFHQIYFSKNHILFRKIIDPSIFLCIVLLFFTTKIYAEIKTYRVGAFNYYPAIFLDKDDSIKGFYVDALREIEKEEGIKFEFVYGSWKEGLERLKNGEIDIITSAAKSPERIKIYDYTTTPLLTVWGELYVSLGSEIDGLLDIQKKKIGIMRGDYNALFFKELTEKIFVECEFVEYNEFEDIFKAIVAKEIDAGVVNNTYGISKYQEYNLRSTGVVFNPFDIYFAVKRGTNREVLEILDKYLGKWKHEKNSVFNQARQKWAHGRIGNIEVFPKWLQTSLFIVAILLIVFLSFIILLRKQVRKATRDIMAQKETLRLNEEKFHNYVEFSPIGIFLMHQNGNIIDVNPTACAISGYSEEELLKLSIKKLCSGSCYERLEKAGNFPFYEAQEIQILTKNSELKWWSINFVRLSEELLLCYANDIDQRKKDEILLKEKNEQIILQNEELHIAKEKAEESDRLKTAFLQNMSHEIRTPMNAIMGFSEILPNYFHDKEKLAKFSNIIKQRGSDLIAIISDILDLAKIEAGQLPIHIENCQLEVLFAEIESFFKEYQSRIQKSHINFSLTYASELKNYFIKTDPVKLKQILINLVGNAFKFTHEGAIHIEISYLENESAIQFKIRDTGIGIEKNKHEEIFERFRQGNSETSRLYGGTGLGLSIVKGLLQLLNGKIWLHSIPQKGSEFFFTIPCILQKNEIDFQKRDILLENKTRNVTILIVEDDPNNTEYFKEILGQENINLFYADSGEEAVRICLQNEIHLVLMDIRIYGMQGNEAIKEIKKLKPHIKIIAQTAYATSMEKKQILELGADDFISKPINKELLLHKMEVILNSNS